MIYIKSELHKIAPANYLILQDKGKDLFRFFDEVF